MPPPGKFPELPLLPLLGEGEGVGAGAGGTSLVDILFERGLSVILGGAEWRWDAIFGAGGTWCAAIFGAGVWSAIFGAVYYVRSAHCKV